jgi:hypothetical protein
LANEIAAIFSLAEAVDKEISRINGDAPDGSRERLRGVELVARDLVQHTKEYPALTATCELRCWDASERTMWPQRSRGAFAAEFASSMMPVHPGANSAAPELHAARRAEIEKNQRELSQYYEQKAAARKNASTMRPVLLWVGDQKLDAGASRPRSRCYFGSVSLHSC